MSFPRQRPWHHNTRQYTLFEYARLKQACPEGVYISLKPGDPTRWHGVLFVRQGSYAPAILRFQISFPLDYPFLPPMIIFVSDIFHPLVAPLTTYTYTTGSAISDTVSATDEERLPPGGFSLRHGFSHWFGRAQRSGISSVNSSRQVSNTQDGALDLSKTPSGDKAENERASSAGPPSPALSEGLVVRIPHVLSQYEQKTSIVEVLQYVKQAFNDETALDSLPLEAAGNAGAWKAWRAYRISKGSMSADIMLGGGGKQTDEWNWDGVWEERVRRGIDTSISEAVLYGGAGGGGDDLIRFTSLDEGLMEEIRLKVLDLAVQT